MVARLGLEADPPLPPPRAVEPFLRFTRLPDRAMALTRNFLDGDEPFRLRVRDATAEAAVGRPSWLFLDRPQGWEVELAALRVAAEEVAGEAEEEKTQSMLQRRVAVLQENAQRSDRELRRLRQELAGIKDELTGERRARRRSESEAGRLRRKTVELATEVDELRGRHIELRHALDQIDHQQVPALEADAAEEEPEDPQDQSSVDHVALATLVAEGARVASGLGEIMASAGALLEEAVFPPASPGPATPGAGRRRVRRQPMSAPPGVFDDTVEALDHFLRVVRSQVLVDGYNVTKSARGDLGIAEQRRWLADTLAGLAARTGARFELVFDGAGTTASAPADLGRRQGVQMRFSAEGIEADDLVLELIDQYPMSVPVTVVSDDRRVRDGAGRRGANVVSTEQLLAAAGRRSG